MESRDRDRDRDQRFCNNRSYIVKARTLREEARVVALREGIYIPRLRSIVSKNHIPAGYLVLP